MGCAMPTGEVDTTEQPICGNPLGCDSWLNKCTAKGGKEETPPGGIRMCCIADNNGGKVCVSDPDAIVVKPGSKVETPPTSTVIVRPRPVGRL